MKTLLILMLAFLTTGQTSSCDRGVSRETSRNQEVTLKYNQTIEVKAEKLKIKFVSVTEDSRCPQGDQCIRAGNGSIKLDVTIANGKPASVTLNTAGEPQEVIYQGLAIRLVDLQPYPRSGVDINRDNYVITLKIYKQTQAS